MFPSWEESSFKGRFKCPQSTRVFASRISLLALCLGKRLHLPSRHGCFNKTINVIYLWPHNSSHSVAAQWNITPRNSSSHTLQVCGILRADEGWHYLASTLPVCQMCLLVKVPLVPFWSRKTVNPFSLVKFQFRKLHSVYINSLPPL